MDFIDQIKQLSARIEKIKDGIQTEEATKTSMIMPFFQMLGYDVFNPLEFVPEFTADVGIKKGECVDYAIVDEDGTPQILIEAKWCGENLDKHGSQLFRYFSTTKAKFGILTNGIIYRFYTDLDEANKMDDRPFLEFNLLDIREPLVAELKKFQKNTFDIDMIMTTASELKYNQQIRQFFIRQLASPDDDFVRYIVGEVYDGLKTQKVIEEFRSIVKKSFSQFVTEQINDRLKTALGSEDAPQVAPKADESTDDEVHTDETDKGSRIVTTPEEIESFYTIKTLLHDAIGEHTISYKDTISYFGVLLDNNTWKWICRLQIKSNSIKLLLPDENKKPLTFSLNSLDEIYDYKDKLVEVVQRYLNE